MFNAKQFKTILNNIKQMIISNHHITMNSKEISDSLIPLVHHNFRNDVFGVIPQSRTNRRRNEPCEFAYAESPFCANYSLRFVN